MVKNLSNDFVFKYLFGEDTEDSNRALKALLETYLKQQIKELRVKNPELTKNFESMKDSRLDIFVEFNNSVQVDIEMHVFVDLEELANRLTYYSARIYSGQNLKGMDYSEAKQSIVLAFLNGKMLKHLDFCQYGAFYTEHRELITDAMKIILVELEKLNQEKTFENMNETERMAYYFMNYQDRQINSKIKKMIKHDGVIQMINNRVDQIEEERWAKLISDFEKFHENEREMRSKKYNKKIEDAHNQGIQEGKALGIAEGKVEGITETIRAFSKTMPVEAIASALNKTTDEINEILNQKGAIAPFCILTNIIC